MNRRELLKSAAPVATVAMGLSASAQAAALAATPSLAALADAAFEADAEHVAALEALAEAKARFHQLVGAPPAMARFCGEADRRLNIGGRPDLFEHVYRCEFFDRDERGRNARRWIARPEALRDARIREHLTHGDSPQAKLLTDRLNAVVAYEDRKDEAFEISGVEASDLVVSATEHAAKKAAYAVIEHRAENPADLALKVKAWGVMKRADKSGGDLNSITPLIMADALRICGAQL